MIPARVRAALAAPGARRPVVTVTWAQSSDGAIAGPGGAPARLSGVQSMTLTHQLRAMHDAILVGIQTVLNDDPLLSVRLVEGPQPRPVVLDSRLRFPLGARLLSRTDISPWIFHSIPDIVAECNLSDRGATLFRVPAAKGGLDLRAVLSALREQGIASLMVEGGARVLSSFLRQGLADQAVVTVSPFPLQGGVPGPGLPRLSGAVHNAYGDDRVTWGMISRDAPRDPLAN